MKSHTGYWDVSAASHTSKTLEGFQMHRGWEHGIAHMGFPLHLVHLGVHLACANDLRRRPAKHGSCLEQKWFCRHVLIEDPEFSSYPKVGSGVGVHTGSNSPDPQQHDNEEREQRQEQEEQEGSSRGGRGVRDYKPKPHRRWCSKVLTMVNTKPPLEHGDRPDKFWQSLPRSDRTCLDRVPIPSRNRQAQVSVTGTRFVSFGSGSGRGHAQSNTWRRTSSSGGSLLSLLSGLLMTQVVSLPFQACLTA